jgi:hypothetical protein
MQLWAKEGQRALNTMDLFLRQHAIAHSAEMAGESECEWSFQDGLLDGFSEEQIRLRPQPGMNSVVWLIWHIARTEDVVMNLLVAGRPQVLQDRKEDWPARLKLSRADIGTGTGDQDVADISANLDIPALLAYRMVVGRRTREIVRALKPKELAEPADPSRIVQVCPPGYEAAAAYINRLNESAFGSIRISHDLLAEVRSADVIYTDCWPSAQSAGQRQEIVRSFAPYCITGECLALAPEHAIFLPCPPVHRGEEVSPEAMIDHRCRVYTAKAYLLHAQNAVLTWVMN